MFCPHLHSLYPFRLLALYLVASVKDKNVIVVGLNTDSQGRPLEILIGGLKLHL